MLCSRFTYLILGITTGKYTRPEKNFGEGNVLAKEKAFSPQKRTSSILKHEIS
jgi:hypothetical protein